MPHKGIPTKYRNVQFRSRLEARWAAFFDLAGWEWHYEPVDFDGWIPDFVLVGHDRKVFAEVKPIFDFDEDVAAKIERATGIDKFFSAGMVLDNNEEYFEAIILGAKLPAYDIYRNEEKLGVGWLFEGGWGIAPLFCVPEGKCDFCHEEMSYHGRMTGFYDGNVPDSTGVEAFWAEAGNRTQWRRPHS